MATTTHARSAAATPRKVVFTVAIVVVVALGIPLLVGSIRPVDLLLAGGEGPSAALLQRDFPGKVGTGGTGYDGQQVYALARTFPHLRDARPYLDNPRYRATRILLSALGSWGGTGNTLVLSLLAANIAGIIAGVAGLALLAAQHNRSAWAGAAFAVALVLPALVTTSEPLAYGLGLLALGLTDRDRPELAILLLAIAVLGRDSTLAFAAGAAILLALRRRFVAAALTVAVPGAVLLIWQRIVASMLPGFFRPPIELFAIRHVDHGSLVADLAVLGLGWFAAWRWRDVPGLAFAALAFGATSLVFETEVLQWLAILRVGAPAIALGLAAMFPVMSGREANVGDSASHAVS